MRKLGQGCRLGVSLKACEDEIAEYMQAILQLEEDTLLAFKSGLLVARDHADRSKVWDQIDWTTIWIPSNIEATVPPYFRQPGKIRKLSREYDKQCETSKGKEKQQAEFPSLYFYFNTLYIYIFMIQNTLFFSFLLIHSKPLYESHATILFDMCRYPQPSYFHKCFDL